MPAPYRDVDDSGYDSDEFTALDIDEIKSEEEYDSEFEMIEESVESVSNLHSDASSQLVNHATLTSAFSQASASRSSLPSLLPSINNMSIGLTSLGRAHFSNATLFGKSVSSSSHPPTTSSLPSKHTSSTSIQQLTSEQLQAYQIANLLCASESLGIHPIIVPSLGSTPSFVHVDDHRLLLWCGAMHTDITTNTAGVTQNGIYLRAGVGMTEQDAIAGTNSSDPSKFLHIFLDSSSTPPSTNTISLADSDENSAFEAFKLSSCYGLKCFSGCYRLRVLSIESSMPTAADSYEVFKEKSCRIDVNDAGDDNTENGTAATSASPFDIEPIKTVYVAIEKVVHDEEIHATSSSSPSTPHILPLLPLNTSHTFWLSTHHPSLVSRLLFSSPSSMNPDSFEVTLEMLPLHLDILKEVNVKEVEIEEDERKRRSKRAKNKRKCMKKKIVANTLATSSSSSQPNLVSVSIQVVSTPDSSNLVELNFHPTNVSSSSSTVTTSTPSLVDLLATLAVSPTSLPSSILHTDQSMSQLAELTSDVLNQNQSVMNRNDSTASCTQNVPSTTLSSSTTNHLLASFEYRHVWPYTVELSAMRLSEESEGHATFESLDLIHNRQISNRKSEARTRNILKAVRIGDHEITLLRTVGLLCSWSHPHETSTLNQPVLVSQTPLISYHVQMMIKRIDAEEAREREMNQMLGGD